VRVAASKGAASSLSSVHNVVAATLDALIALEGAAIFARLGAARASRAGAVLVGALLVPLAFMVLPRDLDEQLALVADAASIGVPMALWVCMCVFVWKLRSSLGVAATGASTGGGAVAGTPEIAILATARSPE
jgi:hypothetical protein